MRFDQKMGFLWLGLGLALSWGSSKLGLGNLHKPGPGFMPFLTGGLLAFFGILQALVRPPQTADKSGETESIKKFLERGVYCLGVSFLYALLLEPLGFIAATFLYMLSLLKIMGVRRWPVPVILSLATVLVSYLVFNVWLRINFPRGMISLG